MESSTLESIGYDNEVHAERRGKGGGWWGVVGCLVQRPVSLLQSRV